jgi:hypothetical protein
MHLRHASSTTGNLFRAVFCSTAGARSIWTVWRNTAAAYSTTTPVAGPGAEQASSRQPPPPQACPRSRTREVLHALRSARHRQPARKTYAVEVVAGVLAIEVTGAVLDVAVRKHGGLLGAGDKREHGRVWERATWGEV